MTRPRHVGFLRQWGWPIVLAVLSVCGLMSALIGEGGLWWWLSWLALGAPPAMIAWHVLRSGGKGGAGNARHHSP